jgi:hypothetical protein
MNITYLCPHCEQSVRQELPPDAEELACPQCGVSLHIPRDAIQAETVTRCLVCPSEDLYVRKDFPQRLGVGLVVLGIVGSSIAWAYSQVFWTFAILFATALVDVALYAVVGDALMCYRCHAQYRGTSHMQRHGQFSLETHERHRQMVARTGEGR